MLIDRPPTPPTLRQPSPLRSTAMKALLCKAFGPASSLQLEDIPSPTPKAN